jgi:amino acid adenylation domain-containing protein
MSEPASTLSPEKQLLLQRRLKSAVGRPPAGATIQRRGRETAPLSFGQRQMWVIDQMTAGNPAYNLPVGYRLKGPLDVPALEAVFSGIIRRHEVLRTTFRFQAGEPVQVVNPPWRLTMEWTDLASLPDDRREHVLQEHATLLSVWSFNLTKLPLMRVALVRLGEDEHVLLLNLHHIISDGLSCDVLLREIDAGYRAFRSGTDPALPPLPIQYSDFASWQREDSASRRAAQIEFWKKQLGGELPVLDFPWDKPRPALQSFQGSNVYIDLPGPLCARLQSIGAAQGGTFFMVMLAAFYSILHRYSGASDLIIGAPIANRALTELQPLIGNFLNMVALRCDLSGDPSFNRMLCASRDLTLSAFAHQEVPFEQVVESIRLPRDPSRNPVFQTMLQVLPRSGSGLADLQTSDFHFDLGFAQFDLSLHLYEMPDGYTARFEYCTDLLERATVARFARHFLNLLRGAAANPDAPVSEIPLLSDSEREQVLRVWNDTARDYPRETTVHALFEAQARRTPGKVAVEFERQRITYRDLDRRADALAAELRRLGVGPDTPVGLQVERSVDMVAGVLGILKAGSAYVPLDPGFPRERLAFMAADAGLPVLVTQSRLVGDLPDHRAKVVLIDRLPATVAPPALPAGAAENLAYILYTSGSTGRPKGVQIPHRAVVNFLESMRREPGLQPEDTWLAITTLSFDIAGLELFLPLTTGARVVIASREDATDASRLARLIENSGATVMQATPATWRMLLDSGWSGARKLKILCGGEAMDRPLAERLMASGRELWNMYGPTETTIWSTTERLARGQGITIGRPIANTTVHILDRHAAPVPPGVVGELFIGGDGVARGYLNRPGLTAEKFVPDPFAGRDAAKLYRTGDLARFRADGRIEFLGRADQQVKLRGFRIELGEIEAALAAAGGVAREDTPGDSRLVAYVVPKVAPAAGLANGSNGVAPAAVGPAAWRAALRQNLPEYMIPSAFMVVEALPLTPNGKVDRKALPAPDHSKPSNNPYEPPLRGTEEKLAEIMAALLRLSKVGRKDDFFELGGHSILAVRLFNEIEEVFGKRIPLATLYRAPTVERLAAALDAATATARRWASLVPVQTTGSRPRFFCVHGAGGNVLLYRDLVRSLGPGYPFFGLQSQGLDRQTPPLRTVEAMAAHYLDEILTLQPEGPYCLGGYCLGGVIAYEIAQRLHRAGREVALLALFDSYNLRRVSEVRQSRLLWQKIRFHLGNIGGLSLRDLPGYLSNKLRVANEGELSALWRKITGRGKPGNPDDTVERSVHDANDAAAASYRPLAYDGRVTLFNPRVNYDALPDPQMGWGDVVTGELEVIKLPVNPHAMLVEPFVKHLAAHLQQKLDAVAAASQDSGRREFVPDSVPQARSAAVG